jgi:hypothetical protein
MVKMYPEVAEPTIINQVLNNAFANFQYNVVLWLYSKYSAIIDLCHHKQILNMFYSSCDILSADVVESIYKLCVKQNISVDLTCAFITACCYNNQSVAKWIYQIDAPLNISPYIIVENIELAKHMLFMNNVRVALSMIDLHASRLRNDLNFAYVLLCIHNKNLKCIDIIFWIRDIYPFNHYSPGNFVAWRTSINLLPRVVIN